MLFRRSRAVTYSAYGRQRSRWRLPRWLWLLLAGTAIGSAGLLLVQQRYLPPRLTVDASERLSAAVERAEAQRSSLAAQFDQASRELAAALARERGLAQDLAASRTTAERLKGDLTAVVQALPPDPRQGQVEVRAAHFAASAGQLAYDVVLTRERAGSQPQTGVMQLVLAGESARRSDSSVSLKPIPLALGRHEVVRGSVALPEGFRARQATVQILDRASGTVLAMRIWVVR